MLALTSAVHAHFPITDSAGAGPIHATRESAYLAFDIVRSQAMNRVGFCEYPYTWVEFEAPEDFELMVGAIVPVIERFWDTRVAVAVIGPGLPYDELSKLPQDVQDQVPAGMGAVAIEGVEDQSTCNFLEDTGSLEAQNSGLYVDSFGGADITYAKYSQWPSSRCFYHEEFGGSDMWIVQDKLVKLRSAGKHYLVFWSPGDEKLSSPAFTSKYGVVFGAKSQPEDFAGGEMFLNGQCSLTMAEFHEQDCHAAVPTFMGACIPFNGVAVPNLHSCSVSSAAEPKCNSLCPNYGSCPDMEGGYTCPATLELASCTRSCARDECGSDDPKLQRGHVGPGCTADCKLQSRRLSTHWASMAGEGGDTDSTSTTGVMPDASETECPLECNGQFPAYPYADYQTPDFTPPVDWDAAAMAKPMTMSMGCGETHCDSTRDFMSAAHTMGQAMAVDYTCDINADFVRGMIPHHQGAVDMCVVLTGGMTMPSPMGDFDPSSLGDTGGDFDWASMGAGDTPGSTEEETVDWASMGGGRRSLLFGATPQKPIFTPTEVDSRLVELCVNITLDQMTEINWMKGWLASRSKAQTASCDQPSASMMDGMAGMAGTMQMNHAGSHDMSMVMGCGDLSCSSSASFVQANLAMHEGMAVRYTCDANVDFVRGMIPHHRGGVDMCTVLMHYASISPATVDQELVVLCEHVIGDQSKEVEWMQRWLDDHNHGSVQPC